MTGRPPRAIVGCLVALLGLCLGSVATPAEAAPPSPSERRLLLRPIYDALTADPRFAALRGDYDRARDPASLDRLLVYMGISPLDYLEIDMMARTYEQVVPRSIFDQHRRWLTLHPDLATAWWGPVTADAARSAADPRDGRDTAPPENAAAVSTNRDPAFDQVPEPEWYDGEIQIAVNPHDLDQVVAASNTWDIDAACTAQQEILSIFYSADAGESWRYVCAPGVPEFVAAGLIPGSGTNSCQVAAYGADPDVYWNDHGEVFVNYLLLCDRATGARPSLVVARSADGGATWSAQGVVSNGFGVTSFNDKNFYAIDNHPGSPYYGRHYTCWDRDYNARAAYSTNNGATWTEVDVPEGTALGDVGCDIAVQRDGTVHEIYATYKTSPPTYAKLFYTRSTDGGASWSTPVLVRSLNLVPFTVSSCPPADDARCLQPLGSIGVDSSGGVCDGTLYVTFTDYATSVADSDVYVTRSTDGGAHWSAPVRVNDVATGTQFHSFLVVDEDNGYPVTAWHDTRNDAANRAVDFYASRSKDCGVTWEANTRASAPSNEFNNSSISTSNENTASNSVANPNQYGEYLGLDVQSGRAYVSWTDSRQFFPVGGGAKPQRENIAFALVDFGDLFSDGFETSSTSAWSVVGP